MRLIKGFYAFAHEIYENRFVIGQLVKRDYKNRYLGSFLGFVWTIIQPVVMILVLWCVFVLGFKSGPMAGGSGQVIPFIAWLSVGIIAWNFFAEAFPSSTNVFQEYSYLVKKINFKIAILPIVKLLSSFVTHLIFIIIGIVILLVSGVSVSWYWIQVLYYLAAMMILLLGLSWVASSLQVFVKDISQVVNVVLQFGFWLTPVVWNFDIVPKEWQFWFKLNPMFYIVDGYRKSFLFEEAFWKDQQLLGLYFWGFTLIVLILGVFLFRKLRPHFADVL
ncbi:MAG: ABC transporter permease [Candidatus Gracilibacteria bacterium]